MCHPVRCRICGKTTWAGCGDHVDQVMSAVRPPDRCPGHTDQQRPKGLLRRIGRRR